MRGKRGQEETAEYAGVQILNSFIMNPMFMFQDLSRFWNTLLANKRGRVAGSGFVGMRG